MDKRILTSINSSAGTIELSNGLLSLGRNPTNDFRLQDATVSSFHCELIVTDESILVRDLNSTNGTFIDGHPVQEAVLEPGQILRLGHAELRVDVQPAPPPVEISIPKISVEGVPSENHLLDGSLGCQNHPGVAAVFKCTKCGQAVCGGCVRVLKLQGGTTRLFCPSCSGPCERLPSAAAEKKKQSLLGRLTQTIRIRLSK
jgi:pSer/pThr/pTyr-binding forkhead associated (FHA) protein